MLLNIENQCSLNAAMELLCDYEYLNDCLFVWNIWIALIECFVFWSVMWYWFIACLFVC